VYLDYVKGLQLNKDAATTNLHIVYTQLHGTGQKLVPQALQNYGFQHITIVDEQKNPDPNFPTVSAPNPEEAQAFQLTIQYGKQANADLLLATDPDADRLGIAVKNNSGDYVLLTGNQTGALLLYYVLSQKKEKGMLADNSVMLKTIVTSELGRAIARNYGVQTVDTLTGFKYIAEKIERYRREETKTFQFGYEESYGYLIGDFVCDKDAVQAAVMIAEAAAYHKQQEVIDLPSSNVLQFWLQDGSWFAIRPSSTEPKVKFYLEVKQGTENRSEKRLEEIQSNVMGAVKNMIYN